MGSPSGAGGDQWGCFGGFPSDGGSGVIVFSFEYTGEELARLSGLTFDVFSESAPGGLHGPTEFFVRISADGSPVWLSEEVTLTPGFVHAISWSLGNPDGDDTNGDGFSLTSGDFSWLDLSAGDLIEFEIVARGANSSLVGLDLNNVQVHACVVPEPSSAVMLLLGGMVLAFRTRRVMRRD